MTMATPVIAFGSLQRPGPACGGPGFLDTVFVQTSISRSGGKLAALMTQTQLVLPREPAATKE
jgi:hypothetical protein